MENRGKKIEDIKVEGRGWQFRYIEITPTISSPQFQVISDLSLMALPNA
jgi:hypothetical protein